MTTAISKELSPQEKSLQTISTYIMARKDALMQVIANGLSPERLVKIVCAAASRSPRLLQCTPASIYSCLHTSAQLGLELGGPLKHAHPVPFMNRKSGQMECTLIIGYEGYLELVRRTGQIQTIYAEAVRQGDPFDYELGLHRDIKHKRKAAFDASGKNVIAAYGVAHLKDGGFQMTVMMRDEIDAIMNRSKARDDGPWMTDFEEMARKTLIRRLQKYLPKSVEAADALERADAADDSEEISTAMIEGTSGLELPAPAADTLKERLKAAPQTAVPIQTVGVSANANQPPVGQTINPATETKTRRRKAAPEQGTQINPTETAAGKPETATPAPAATASQTPPSPAASVDPDEAVEPDQLDFYMGTCVNISAKMGNGLYKFTFDDNSVFYGAGDQFALGMHKHREAKQKLDIGFLTDQKEKRDMIKSVSIHEDPKHE